MKEVYDYIQESPKLYISLVHQVQLYYDGYAPLLLLSGGVSVKSGEFPVLNQRLIFMIRKIKLNMSFIPMYC